MKQNHSPFPEDHKACKAHSFTTPHFPTPGVFCTVFQKWLNTAERMRYWYGVQKIASLGTRGVNQQPETILCICHMAHVPAQNQFIQMFRVTPRMTNQLRSFQTIAQSEPPGYGEAHEASGKGLCPNWPLQLTKSLYKGQGMTQTLELPECHDHVPWCWKQGCTGHP